MHQRSVLSYFHGPIESELEDGRHGSVARNRWASRPVNNRGCLFWAPDESAVTVRCTGWSLNGRYVYRRAAAGSITLLRIMDLAIRCRETFHAAKRINPSVLRLRDLLDANIQM
ncbi:unnamed protein product [Urochloa humidicola]